MAPSTRWRAALPALAFAVSWVLFWYWDTGVAMVTIWARSETFTHAFLVPPISFWLIWRQRDELATLRPGANWFVLILLAAAGFSWLLGELAAVNAVAQLAMVTLLVLTVPAVLGLPVARALAFPLAYLFFAVPIGEFIMPSMMDWTADFTVRALQLTGIPVYREGLNFVIPSGNWSVVEACSGIRYLIASVTVGTLYAYLNYRTLTRRLVFVAVSILVPIVANWVRAYMIVMLGHLSGNKLAVGVDHLIYGWIFFGVVILLMFMIGARWAEHSNTDGQIAVSTVTASPPNAARIWLAAALVAAVVVFPHVWLRSIDRLEAGSAAPLPHLALAVPGWQAADVRTIDWRPAYANPLTERHAEFIQGEHRAGVFIGYYRQQTYEQKLVSSENVLIKTSNKMWTRIATGTRLVALGDQSVLARTAELRGVTGQRLIVWQWYWINGWLTTNDHLAKAYQAASRLLGRGDDSAAIILYTLKDAPEGGEAVLEEFANTAGLIIEAALQPTP